MKKLFFLFTLCLLIVGMAWAETYTENFDTAGNWAGTMSGYTAKAYISSADPADDEFSSDNAFRETGDTNSGAYAWRLQTGAYYFRYECSETVNGFSIYLARWDNSPKPAFTVRYSTDSGSNYTDIETLDGDWFTGDKVYKQYVYTFPTPVSPNTGETIFIEINKTVGERMLLDDFVLEYGSSAPTPAITISESSLTGFTYVHNNGPSAEQSFTVSGANLTGNITITAPADYEISTTSGSFVGSTPIDLIPISGEVPETAIYVRLKAGLGVGTYEEDITASSEDATDRTVTCNGEVSAPPAPAAPVATAATSIDDASFIANWEAVPGVSGYYLDIYTKEAGATTSDLFFSEYIEGSGNNKAIEIYNGTGAEVDLSDYRVVLYSNGASEPGNTLNLTGTLADGEVYVIANAGADASILAVADITSTVTYFNGDDAFALYKISTDSFVDIFGVIGDDPGTQWTGDGGYSTLDKTLVRKSDVDQGITVNPTGTGPEAFTTLTTEWDVYDIDTFTYLGAHDFVGGVTKTYVQQNLDVGNVISYAVTGLTPETTYYYVVRTYINYQTHVESSVNSNEISVSTEAPAATGVVVNFDGDDTVSGAELVVGGDIPEELLGPDTGIPAVIYTISSTGTKDVLVNRHSSFGNVDWYCWLITSDNVLHSADVITSGTNSHLFEAVNFDAKGEVIIIMNDNPTLPVELSTFNVALNSENAAVLTWITQTETGVSGFHIYRNTEDLLANALLISDLIPATNTSEEHKYNFSDTELNGLGTYYYWLQVADLDGSDRYHGPISLVYENENEEQTPEVLVVTELKKVFPNPFNPNTTISYYLDKAAKVSINIYNSRGQLVRSFEEGVKAEGNYNLAWNGEDYRGRSLPTGVYYIRMQAGHKSFNKKAVLMK